MRMTNRRRFIGAILAGVVAGPLARAQSTARLPRVGVLLPGAVDSRQPSPNLAAFENGLRESGWIEGKNLLIERRYADGRSERYRDLALDLVRHDVAVIVPAGGPASLRATREATKTIPIVMVASSRDPVAEGLVKSLARPEGNITGIVTLPAEGGGKVLELLKEAVPAVSRVGVVSDLTISPYRVSNELGAAARSLGVRGLDDFDRAMADAKRAQVGGLLVASTPMTSLHRKEIADLAKANRLPAIALFRSQAEAGLMMTYGPSIAGEFRSAARFVDKILRGAKPADLPVEQPTKFELVINAATARTIGITIPQSLLLRADEVLQ